MFPKTLLPSRLAKVFAAGLLAALIAGCAVPAHSVRLPNEARKFTVGEEVPESFEFFRSDEEIRGRLLAGVWKSRAMKFISYTEEAYSLHNFKVSRKNSPLNAVTFTFAFSEDNKFTGSRTWKHTYAPQKISGHWVVSNGALRIMFSRNGSWEYFSVRFLDDKTIELIRDDCTEYSDAAIADSKAQIEKNGLQVLKINGHYFRDDDGNRYKTMVSETIISQVPKPIRQKVKYIEKWAPFILELQ